MPSDNGIGSDNANPAGLPKSRLPRVLYLLHPKDPLCNTGEDIYNNYIPIQYSLRKAEKTDGPNQ